MILKELRPHVLAMIEAGNSVLLVSSSGRGKSEWCEQLFGHLKTSTPFNWGYQSLFLATQTPPDLVGYQFKADGTYDNRPFIKSEASLPLWAVSTEGKPYWAYDRYFLVMDEFGQGEADVKKASAELWLKKALGPWALMPGSVVIGCTNVGPRYGVSKNFDFVINRQAAINVTDDVDSWLDWASKPYSFNGREWNVMPVTKAFGQTNPATLFEPEPAEQGPWCTPRSLCAADRYLQCVSHGANVNPSDPRICEAVAGMIGAPAGAAYMGHLQFLLELPPYLDVVADPTGTPVPTKPDRMMLMAYQLAAMVKKEHLHAVVAYMQRQPFTKDLAITFMKSLIMRDKTFVIEQPILKWVGKNATLLSMLENAAQS